MTCPRKIGPVVGGMVIRRLETLTTFEPIDFIARHLLQYEETVLH